VAKRSHTQRNSCRPYGQWPVPHTPAWFAQMLPFHPPAVFFAQTHIARTGRLDICSVCGDTPAPIYDAVNAPHQSLRLCADCLGIRAALYDERYRLRPERA